MNSSQLQDTVKSILDFIESNLTTKITLEQLARNPICRSFICTVY